VALVSKRCSVNCAHAIGQAGAVPSALLASHPCVQDKFKATEKRNVCLCDATDVVPIADARMRWPGVSSNSEWECCWCVLEHDGKAGDN
jgi:hypothetical protein